MSSAPVIGVVIVAYNSGDVILDCPESLSSQEGLDLRVVLVDNASPDHSVARIRAWAKGAEPRVAPADSPLEPVPPAAKPVALVERAPGEGGAECLAPLTILHALRNLGYAGGVNLELELIAADKDAELLWILNPDCVVPPQTIPALLAHRRICGSYSIMGERILYHANRRIHADGGRVWRWSGVCESVNRGADAAATEAAPLAFGPATAA